LSSRAGTDFAKRKQQYADMQTMIHNESGIGIPLFFPSIDGHTTKLKGLTPLPLGNLMGYAYAENVWLNA
jgi:peptide/nickel transport system substrate-binding protein